MAGGGGTRFWPLSRKDNPKQLLNLSGKDLMVNETISRFNKVIDKNNIYIVTNKTQVEKMIVATKDKVVAKNILSEPSARNTAACIGYAAIKILHDHGDGVLVVSPSDAFIKNEDKFAGMIKEAIKAAEETNGIITIGVNPTFPATGYGYIHFDNKNDQKVKKVFEFVEKPDLDLAKQYFLSGEFVWNAGIFVWKASTIINKFKELLPDIYEKLMEIEKSLGTKFENDVLNRVYPEIRSISIDYGVMEKSNDIYVISDDFGRNDVGSWDMMNVLHEADNKNNILLGDTLTINTKNSIIYSSKKIISTVDVDNLIVVETDDAILVCPRDKAQDVKLIVDELKKKGRTDLL